MQRYGFLSITRCSPYVAHLPGPVLGFRVFPDTNRLLALGIISLYGIVFSAYSDAYVAKSRIFVIPRRRECRDNLFHTACGSNEKNTCKMPELSVLVLFAAIFIVSLKGFRDQSFFRRYLFDVNDVKYRREYYRLITCGFLHTDWLHLLFNMITLYFFFGVPFAVLGEMRFFLLYFAGLAFVFVRSQLPQTQLCRCRRIGRGNRRAFLGHHARTGPKTDDNTHTASDTGLRICGGIPALHQLRYAQLYGQHRSFGGAASGILLTIIMYPSVLVYSPWVTTGLAVLVLALMGLELCRQGRGSWGQR